MSKKNTQLLILVGAPGSGKSTFAKYHLRTHTNWARVCRDDFRSMHFAAGFMPDKDEAMITKMIDGSIEAMLVNKTNVIADATHTKKVYLDEYIKKFGHLADISFKVFEASREVLNNRCREREVQTGKVIPAAAVKQHSESLELLKAAFDFAPVPRIQKQNTIAVQDAALPKAIICDLDGTLALLNGRNPFDASNCEADVLNQPVAGVLQTYAKNDYKIILVSGREVKFEEQTRRFLWQHGIPFDLLLMRNTAD
ncbi:MAG: polynucleotide kinase, partial [Sphingobacteriales bacterium]